ncbi:family 78 glycoside hydrolase catalytic domain [Cohnella sp. GCM10020058]|uniref:family 78 glycoside hydrolase catalytic domain n=1 Tax=Cohnella sp. GCM10020058 TaxID=3317330 RepID=UPI00362BAC55
MATGSTSKRYVHLWQLELCNLFCAEEAFILTIWDQAERSSRFRLYSLKVNGLTSPLGIDNDAIRLSWQLSSQERGFLPTAVQVCVAETERQLLEGEFIWTSGKLPGSAWYADYGGAPLKGNVRYCWNVVAWDSDGRFMDSEPACWDTGLYPDDWTADWIWSSREVKVNDFAYFRKVVDIRDEVAYAKLFVSAHNVVHVYLDGEKIGGYGSPAPTNPWKRKLYMAYDVTAKLKPGACSLAAVAHYLGGSGQNYVNGLPGLRAQLEIVYRDGTRHTCQTDESWQVLEEIPHQCATPYQQNRRLSAIEVYDAAKISPDWNLASGTSGTFGQAVQARIGRKEWPMKWQELQEGGIEEEIAPVLAGEVSSRSEDETKQVFDVGKIVSGWPRITLKGYAGITIRLRYSEALEQDGSVKRYVANETAQFYYDEYTMRGEARECWQPDFSYKAFRYVEVTGYPEKLLPGDNLTVVSAHTALAQEGRFRCSNPLLNDLYAVAIQTQKNNVLGQAVDCPHREQAQYLADTDLQAELLLYNFDAAKALEKTLGDFADAQLTNGTFPFVTPTNYEEREPTGFCAFYSESPEGRGIRGEEPRQYDPEGHLQIPEWDTHFCTLLWKVYYQSGDERLLSRHYETAKRLADYFLGIADAETGLIPLGKGWHISDWPYPSVEQSSDFLTVLNLKVLQAVRILAAIAGLLHRQKEQETYAVKADHLAMCIRKAFFDEEKGLYRDCSGSDKTHQGVNALALAYDVVPAERRSMAIESVAAKPWECKTVLSLPLLRVLFENRKEEAAYRLLTREEYPGWGYMICQGATTLWEGWDDMESHCHAWNGYPGRMLQEYVAGIAATAPGFAEVSIRPYMPDELLFAEATVPTVRGMLLTRWEKKENGEASFFVKIPPGVSGVVTIPSALCKANNDIHENGRLIWRSEGGADGAETPNGIIDCFGTVDGVVIRLDSGAYTFEIRRN